MTFSKFALIAGDSPLLHDARLEVDGHDIGSAVAGYTIKQAIDRLPQVTLDLIVHVQPVELADPVIIVPAQTVRALQVLGWTPPAAAASEELRALIAEALIEWLARHEIWSPTEDIATQAADMVMPIVEAARTKAYDLGARQGAGVAEAKLDRQAVVNAELLERVRAVEARWRHIQDRRRAGAELRKELEREVVLPAICEPEDGEAGAKHIVEQAAENQRLRVELDAKDAQIERLAEEREQYQRAAKIFQALRLVLDTGQAPSEWAKPWRERAETAEAEWGRLRAAVERVRRLIDKGPSRRCGGQRYILANLISAALGQSDTSTPQQAADGTHAAGTGRNQTP